jgi:hypothetical protein
MTHGHFCYALWKRYASARAVVKSNPSRIANRISHVDPHVAFYDNQLNAN